MRIARGECIALAGAGGKTSLMWALARGANAPPGARLAALINKAEDERSVHAAYTLAQRLLVRGAPRLERVLIGAARRAGSGFAALAR